MRGRGWPNRFAGFSTGGRTERATMMVRGGWRRRHRDKKRGFLPGRTTKMGEIVTARDLVGHRRRLAIGAFARRHRRRYRDPPRRLRLASTLRFAPARRIRSTFDARRAVQFAGDLRAQRRHALSIGHLDRASSVAVIRSGCRARRLRPNFPFRSIGARSGRSRWGWWRDKRRWHLL